MDGQVKLRGFRVELGEVEAELRAVPGVDGAACLLGDSGRIPALAAYLVADRAVVPPARVRDALAGRLPAHMLPQRLHYLDRLPVTPHGKLDRDALLTGAVPGRNQEHGAPRTTKDGGHRAG